MSRRSTAFVVCAGFAVALWALYGYHLTAAGLFGPDEPRYAAIGRNMAFTGDWVTPRLWGEAWFEKPALLYWMTALATLAGFGVDLAPRVLVAVLSVAFLLFFFWMLRREFDGKTALYSALILGSSAGWIAYSQSGVTDLPLAVTFSAFVLLTIPWLRRREKAWLLPAAAMLGLAVLAKGLVPLVLAIPLLWSGRGQWRDLFHPPVALVFLIVAMPWYVLCTLYNGAPFLRTFFLQHTFGRFVTADVLQHGQPFWFYLPTLLAALFPWTFLLPLLFRRPLYREPATQFLLLVVVFGFVFFSSAANKLPGYLLPLLPSLSVLLGYALCRVKFAGFSLLGCWMMLSLLPVVGFIVPLALYSGIRNAYPIDQAIAGRAALLMPILLITGIISAFADRAGKRTAVMIALFSATVVGVVWLKVKTLPEIDRAVSARSLWQEGNSRHVSICAGNMSRSWRYGLNYYFNGALADCHAGTASWEFVQQGSRPVLLPRQAAR